MITRNRWKKNMAAGIMQALFDLNILLDVLQERQVFYDFSARLLAYDENRDCREPYTTSLQTGVISLRRLFSPGA